MCCIPRRGGRHSGLGIAGDRTLRCDVCDLRLAGQQWACMAADYFERSRIQAIVRQQRNALARRQQRGSRSRHEPHDPECRRPRYALYRGFIAEGWSDPLGAENRVRLPACLVCKTRRTFPNPVCGPTACDGRPCDYGALCESHGHYLSLIHI